MRGQDDETNIPFVAGRRSIAVAWLLGGGLAAFFLVGCCILPFHAVMHRLLPFCQIAAALVAGEETGHGHEHPSEPASGQKRDTPAPREASCQPVGRPALPAVVVVSADCPPASPARFRSQVSLGAVRCDEDVGARLALLETLRI